MVLVDEGCGKNKQLVYCAGKVYGEYDRYLTSQLEFLVQKVYLPS